MITIEHLIFIGGTVHLLLSFFSLSIPKLLSWNKHLSPLPPLFRQMFWVYSGYILLTNIFFGILSITNNEKLTDGSGISALLTGFIAFYWLTRLIIQFSYFDRSSAPKGWIYTVGEVSLVLVFIYLSLVYSYAFYINL